MLFSLLGGRQTFASSSFDDFFPDQRTRSNSELTNTLGRIKQKKGTLGQAITAIPDNLEEEI